MKPMLTAFMVMTEAPFLALVPAIRRLLVFIVSILRNCVTSLYRQRENVCDLSHVRM